jgi:Ca2+-binding EF-hand superfamily protein
MKGTKIMKANLFSKGSSRESCYLDHFGQGQLRNVVQTKAASVALILMLPLLGFLTACAYNKNLQPAAATPGTGEGGFELADANHDGKLSRAEASDFLGNQIFDAVDVNHDGKITKEEWTAGGARSSADFKKRDSNHDGIVTRDEALKYGRAHGMTKKAFAEADKNHDGALDRKEVEAYYASREGSPR